MHDAAAIAHGSLTRLIDSCADNDKLANDANFRRLQGLHTFILIFAGHIQYRPIFANHTHT
jgi:hypothetical protein